tara:strand:+ start:15173 stop:15337 length:165 start_codon:yes stop_codon:yes gene_type:complete
MMIISSTPYSIANEPQIITDSWFLVQPAPLNLPTLSFYFMEDNLVTKEFAAFTP